MATKVGKLSYNALFLSFLGSLVITLIILISLLRYRELNDPIFYIIVAIVCLPILVWQFLSTQKLLQQIQLLKDNQNHIFHQVEASQQLFEFIHPRLPLPLTRNWVASPDLILNLYYLILKNKTKTIVELGSGASTIYLSYLIEQHQLDTKILSIDHDRKYAEKTRILLNDHQLSSYASVNYYPLNEKGWYQLETNDIPDNIDLLIVDGPPTFNIPNARNYALSAFEKNLSSNAIIVVDDADRTEGKAMINEWQRHPKIVKTEHLFTEKGTEVLYFQA